MARYGIVSDIHGNLEALAAALAFLDGHARAVDRILCLGDIVGYNADPEPCLRMVQARRMEAIAGNHDLITSRVLGLARCSDKAAFALRRTRSAVAEATAQALRALPRARIVDDEIALIHGGVADVCQYMRTPRHVEENHALLKKLAPRARICLFGHTHVQALYEVHRGVATELPLGEGEEVPLDGLGRRHGDDDDDRVYFVNPGSVDAARRGDGHAGVAILDTDRRVLSFHRVPYDAAAAERRAEGEGYRMRWADVQLYRAARTVRRGGRIVRAGVRRALGAGSQAR